MHTLGRASAVMAAVAVAAMATAGPALAEDPFAMAQRVVDHSTDQVVAADVEDILAAADDVVAETDFDLWTVYVDSFDGMQATDWANETAIASGADSDVLLLAIAVDDGQLALSVAEEADIGDADITDVEAAARAQVNDGNWANASIAASNMIIELATGEAPPTTAEPDSEDAGSSSTALWVMGGIAIVLIGGGLLLARSRRTGVGGDPRPQQPSGPPTPEQEWAQLSVGELGLRAGSALVDLDNDVRSSANELAFAEAQFGLEATQDFKAVLAQAQGQLAQAFTIQQQLNETTLVDDARRQGLVQILTLCRAADAALDAQTAALAELRSLQDRAPEVLAELDQRAGELAVRVPPARDTLRQLGATYPATALATVAKAPDQAEALLASAQQSVAEGRSRVQAGDRGTAIAYARTAEDALQQASQLLGMVADAGTTLADAQRQLDGAIASLTSDVSDAGRLAPDDATIAPAVQRAQAAIQTGSAAKSGGDPIAALSELATAEQLLDAALAPRREQEQVRTRLASQVSVQIAAADGAVRRSNDVIETNRGVVESAARTQLATAVESLARARSLEQNQPEQALAAAQAAADGATSALQLAQADVSRWQRLQEQPPSGGYYGRSGGIDTGSLILGGILGSRSSRSRSTWGGGGSSWGGGGSSTPSRSGWGGGRSMGSVGRSSGGGATRRSGGGSRRSSGGGRRR